MSRKRLGGWWVTTALLCAAVTFGGAQAQTAPEKAEAKKKPRQAQAAARGEQGRQGEKGFVPLFDGKTLEGWEGDASVWSVKDGAIVGHGEMLKENTFLTAKKPYGDFVLRLQIKLVNNEGNTGVQFRSVRVPDSQRLSGFQADYANVAKYCGMLYDEARRGILVQPEAEALAKAANKAGDWNDLEIRAVGDKITLRLNGAKTVEYTESDASIPKEGLLGLQVHAKTNMEVQFRNLRIREIKKRP